MCVCILRAQVARFSGPEKHPMVVPVELHLDQLASATLELRELQRVLRMYVPLSVCLSVCMLAFA